MPLSYRDRNTLHKRIATLSLLLGALYATNAVAVGPSGVTAEDKKKLVDSGPYDLTKTSYDRISSLPAYDHEGTRPVNQGRVLEVAWIDRQIAERASDIRIIEAQLHVFIASSKTPAGAAQIVRDVKARRETYNRWEESMLKRRKAIIEMPDGDFLPVSNEPKLLASWH